MGSQVSHDIGTCPYCGERLHNPVDFKAQICPDCMRAGRPFRNLKDWFKKEKKDGLQEVD